MSAPLVFIDTETDGVHPDRKAWEVAMIRREPDGRQDETTFFVEVDLETADPFGLKVGGFYDRHPLGRTVSTKAYTPERMLGDRELRCSQWLQGEPDSGVLSQSDAALLVAQWTHGAHLVGAVPHFDAEVLGKLLRAERLTPAWHYHLIDIEAMAVGAIAARGKVVPLPWKSDDLTVAVGATVAADDERHTALGDARWAMRVYDAIIYGPSMAPEQVGAP